MDEFNYLIVVVSIVLGLGITKLLTGVGDLIDARARVRVYWPVLAWTLILLLVHVQTWWAFFGLRHRTSWTFLTFLIVLLQPILLYLLSALVLPVIGRGEHVDLRARYFEQARWFLGLFAVLLVGSLGRDLVLDGALPGALNVATHVVLLVLAAVGMQTTRAWFHEMNAGLTTALVTLYIAVLFSQLG